VFTLVGEAFLQIIQRCGAALCVNSSIVVSKILLVLRSDIDEMKSSSLILLSYVAELNPPSLTPFIFQIIGYLQGVLVHEKELHQRRGLFLLSLGALICIQSVLQGMGREFKSIDKNVRGKLLVQLEYISSTDGDQLCRYHASNVVNLYHELCFI
jgi:hypothetical protein